MGDVIQHTQFSPDVSDSEDYNGTALLPPLYTSDNSDSDDCAGNPPTPLINTVSIVEELHQRHDSLSKLLDFEQQISRSEKASKRGGELYTIDDDQAREQLSIIAFMLTALRRSLLTCNSVQDDTSLDISWPTDVQHVTHVTFDRFNGFLGLPVEFEVEVPKRAPSASASVFGVSPESMQCSYDSRGNSVPTILLLMQERLYALGGLQAEGIFRINAENSYEEALREQLNKGIVPQNIDLHCLAGLIKAWFRELPQGVLDSLTPEQVMQCHTEQQCVELVKLLPPTQAALLDWAVNLMADVAQEETANKMNARNIAMVFAPNMTQMADPLTALMHAVQVMNFLKTLILRTIRDRTEAVLDPGPASSFSGAQDDDRHDRDCGKTFPSSSTEKEGGERFKTNIEDYGQCALAHSKHVSTKAKGVKLVNRIDQQSERVEAW
ncbi:hypothetical protein O6H91_02G073400 [Diphasiastrum complanatum]|nr:hypothetical protein O6H91_02G073400 [Diphasiastrum complanatum]